jgi:hypothetical protein
MLCIWHLYENFFPEPFELFLIQIPFDDRVITKCLIHDMLHSEIGTILIPAIRDEDGGIIYPSIPRSGCEHYPVVSFCDLKESLDPSSRSHKALLVEDEKSTRNLSVSANVIP